jgi:23S rRNA (adenine2503-C2)-methyltransferase
MQVHKSGLDESVNFEFGGMECRYVRRNAVKMSIYLSSQKGCKQACRFCFLTQKGHTNDTNVTMDEYEQQLDTVFDHYDIYQPEALRVNYNLMAKGEPLLNREFIDDFPSFYEMCEENAFERALDFRINISTIYPNDLLDSDLEQISMWGKVKFYISLYSMDQDFRKRWLPKAVPNAGLILKKMHAVQNIFNKGYRVHWCYIDDQNDSIEQTYQIGEALANNGAPAVNIVRYNPFSPEQGKESEFDVIQRNVWILKKQFGLTVKIVPRVGVDVNASCGMFI